LHNKHPKPNPQGLQFEYRANEDLLVEKHTTDGDVAYWHGAILRARYLKNIKKLSDSSRINLYRWP
jgi:hypothetical protein